MQITLSWVLKPPLITRDLKSDGDDRRQGNNDNFESTLIYRVCSKTCFATVLIRSIFAREKLHERFSASAVFQRKIERINTVARHVML